MKKKILLIPLALLLAVSLVAIGCPAPAPAPAPAPVPAPAPAPAPAVPEVIEWKMSCHSADSPGFGYWTKPGAKYNRMLHSLLDRAFATWINDVTNGRLKITPVEPNAIFPTSETVENVGAGVIEASFSSQAWAAGEIMECNISETLPYGLPDVKSAYDLYFNYGFYEIMSEVYAERNLIFIPVPISEVAGIITAFPCPTLADLEGKNIRVWGCMGKAMEALGANGLNIPFGEQYMAMKLGTIDGVTTGAVSLENAKLKEIAMGMVTYPKLYTAVDMLIINKDAFSELPDDIQKIIMDQAHLYFFTAGSVEGMQQQYVVAKAKEEYGLQEWKWSEEDAMKARGLCKEKVWQEFGDMSPRCQQLLDLKVNYMIEHGML